MENLISLMILPVKNARRISRVRGCFVNASVLLQQVVAVAEDHVGVDVVDAGQQQVIRVYLKHIKFDQQTRMQIIQTIKT